LSELLLLAVIAWLVYDSSRHPGYWRQLNRELFARMPVFSAETTRGQEAEFIRDRLPKRLPGLALMLTVLLLAGAVVWRWLA
jgi:hypothetical protein